MTDKPRDALLERYAEAVAHDTRRPNDRVRNAARAHAQMLRDQAAAMQRAHAAASPKPAANQPHWTISLVASLAVVGLAGLLYVQIDRGTPEDRDAALGTAAQTEAPPPESPTPAMQARQRPADTPMAAAPTIEHSPVTDAPMANATTDRAYSAPPVETDTAPKLGTKAANQIASAESVARMTPGARATAVMAPAAPAPAAAAVAAAAASGTPRLAREMEASSATALFMEAVRTGQPETIQRLLVQGVAVNTRDDNGNTALMLAVRHRQVAAVRTLLAMGADTSLVNHDGLTALQFANQLGLADMAQLLQAPR